MSSHSRHMHEYSDTSDEEAPCKRVRYKQYFYANYDPHKVSRRTRRKFSLQSSVQEKLRATSDSTESSPNDTELESHNNKLINADSENVIDNVNNNSYSSVVNTDDPFEKDLNCVSNKEENSKNNDDVTENSDLDALSDLNYNNSLASNEVDSECEDVGESEEHFFDVYKLNENEGNFNFNRIMFEESGLTIRDVITMVSALSLRYRMSDEAKLAHINMLQLCAGPQFKNLILSKYVMAECFSKQEDKVITHYFCSQCEDNIIYSRKFEETCKLKNIICEKCEKSNKITPASDNYFLSIDLEYQIKQLFSNEDILDDILKNLQIQNRPLDDSDVKDVNNGLLYQKIMQANNNELTQIITLNFNTDGAPLTKSGKRSFWPLQAHLNELSTKFRFRFMLLCGILIVEKEPKTNLLNLYLSAFVNQVNNLFIKGIKIKKNNKNFVFKFCVLSCVVDSVCRPIIQNRIMFNGYAGCSWCYQNGKYIYSVHGIRYPVEQESNERTHETHIMDVHNARHGVITRGVKGKSVLQDLPNFDLVWSFPYEYMHSMLLGVTYQIFNEWKIGKSEYKLQKKMFELIERKFLNITPTHDIHRLPRRGIITGAAKPKASELKSWLLYYSLPCLDGILKKEALDHYALLVKSAYTLLKTNITKEELIECEKDIIKFVIYYEMLYGEESMTFNLHCLLHAVQSVRETGPLFFNSAFPFENYIYTLKTFISGPKTMDRQMCRKHIQTFIFKTGNAENNLLSVETKKYCSSLFMLEKLNKFNEEVGPHDVLYFGRSHIQNFDEFGKCLVYSKCVYKNTVYHSIKYSRAKKTDDTVVQLLTGNFARILDILSINNQCYLNLSLFETFVDEPFNGVSHIVKIKFENIENTVILPISHTKCKVLLVDIKNARYLCTLPNNIEIQ